jgi:hypothetical protein
MNMKFEGKQVSRGRARSKANLQRFPSRGSLIALMKEAVETSETLVNSYQSTRRYSLEDRHLQVSSDRTPLTVALAII